MPRTDELANLCFPPDLPSSYDSLVIPVDKPHGWTSFGVVRTLRSILGIRKVGHAGTLDPMATGLLICLTGKATRQAEAFMSLPKEYRGTLRLGETTPSYDAETPVTERRPWEGVTDAMLESAAAGFVGEITQRTPMYSAVKVRGERLYRKARRGESAVRPQRQVTVYLFDLTSRSGPDVDFQVNCSKGTYVRSLAHDLGEALNCGAHLVALRRTAIGSIRVESAWSVEAIRQASAAGTERRN